ncbi:keratin-associated protein 12-1-like [Zalophus californianus]|uniref:Keratin-associated protein 12-1-like n=1 Tax=Zalophus californianus TaxID=9704 RepID=A0A6J2CCG8_ZALCA|nr:keratin-associated protein 12-1-like [Zalophus californianus]
MYFTSCSMGCQQASCTPSPCQTSCGIPCQTSCCVPVTCKPAVCLPVSCKPVVCLPVSYKPIVYVAPSCQSSGGCQPSFPTLVCRPAPCGTSNCC